MRFSFLIWLGVFWSFGSSPVRGNVNDVATLFPPDTESYVEITQLKEFIPQFRAIVKGSAFENALPLIQKFPDTDAFLGLGDLLEPGFLSMIFSPEMLNEASRFQSFAFGLTKNKKAKRTEWEAILLTGESQIPGILFRGFLGNNSSIPKSATVDGIDIYEQQIHQIRLGPYSSAPQNSASYTISWTPGALIFASSKEVATMAIKRLKGKEKENLLSSPQMTHIRELRKRAGIVWFANAVMLLDNLPTKEKDGTTTYWGELSREWMLSESFQTFFGIFTLMDSRMELQIKCVLEARKKTPLSLFSGSQGIDTSTLESVPIEVPLGLTIASPKEENDWSKLFQLMDSLIKSSGSLGITPSEAIAEIAQRQRLDFQKAVAPKCRDFSFFLGGSKQGFVPLFRLRMTDSASAEIVEKCIVDFLEMIGGQAKDLILEDIDGQSVRSLAIRRDPNILTVHFARKENVVVLGFDRKWIPEVLNSKNENTLKTVEGYSFLFQPKSSYSLLATLNSGNLIKTLLAEGTSIGIRKKTDNLREPSSKKRPSMQETKEIMIQAELNQIGVTASKLPPILITLSSEKDSLVIRFCQPVESKYFARTIDQTLQWYAKRASIRRPSPRSIDSDIPNLFAPPFGK